MQIVVTGATGCLGGVTARKIAKMGHRVIGQGRDPARGVALKCDGISFAAADLADGARIAALCTGADVIIHCGGLSSAWGRKEAFHEANVIGTQHVVAAAMANQARLVFVSSPSIYFDYRHRLDIRESEGPASHPVNHYAASKIAAEALVTDAAKAGLDAVILRPRAIFGETDTALLPRLLRAAANGYLPLIGGGTALVDLTYVDNAADALIAAALRERCFAGEAINISNGEPIEIRTLFRQIAKGLGIDIRFVPLPFPIAYGLAGLLEGLAFLKPGCPEPRLTRYAVGVLGMSHTLSLATARTELGFQPRISVQEGIARTVRTWKQQHD